MKIVVGPTFPLTSTNRGHLTSGFRTSEQDMTEIRPTTTKRLQPVHRSHVAIKSH